MAHAAALIHMALPIQPLASGIAIVHHLATDTHLEPGLGTECFWVFAWQIGELHFLAIRASSCLQRHLNTTVSASLKFKASHACELTRERAFENLNPTLMVAIRYSKKVNMIRIKKHTFPDVWADVNNPINFCRQIWWMGIVAKSAQHRWHCSNKVVNVLYQLSIDLNQQHLGPNIDSFACNATKTPNASTWISVGSDFCWC